MPPVLQLIHLLIGNGVSGMVETEKLDSKSAVTGLKSSSVCLEEVRRECLQASIKLAIEFRLY